MPRLLSSRHQPHVPRPLPSVQLPLAQHLHWQCSARHQRFNQLARGGACVLVRCVAAHRPVLRARPMMLPQDQHVPCLRSSPPPNLAPSPPPSSTRRRFVDLQAEMHVTNVLITAGGDFRNTSVYVGSNTASVAANTRVAVRACTAVDEVCSCGRAASLTVPARLSSAAAVGRHCCRAARPAPDSRPTRASPRSSRRRSLGWAWQPGSSWRYRGWPPRGAMSSFTRARRRRAR